MRVVRTAIDLQLLPHLAADLVLRQHPPHRLLDHRLRLLRAHETRRLRLQAAGIERVAAIDLVLFFLAGEDDLLGVDDDDVVAGVEERGVGWLVLAGDDLRDLGRQTPQDLALGVDDEPARLDVTLLGEIRTHDSPETSIDRLSATGRTTGELLELHTFPARERDETVTLPNNGSQGEHSRGVTA